MRILAVDDDPVILDLLKGSLSTQEKHQLTCATTGEEALELLEEGRNDFDCFLLDIMLPGIDGIELCDRVRNMEVYRSHPIVVITASRAPDLMGRAFEAGATDFLPKPLNGVELAARINSMATLNDSLHRERAAQENLNTLTSAITVRFEEQFNLVHGEVTDMAALENDLLRLPSGCFAMSLLALDVLGTRGLHKTVKAHQFRAHMERVAAAANRVLKYKSCKLAYAGSGRFVGVVMGRGRLDMEALEAEILSELKYSWDIHATGAPVPPELKLKQVGNQRIWSGKSASDKLRAHLTGSDVMRDESGAAPRGYRIFTDHERAA
jgi:CheY-like chemotaxis protein